MKLVQRKPYSADLEDEQWAILKSPLAKSPRRSAPRRVNLRDFINALLYLSRTGRQWWMLPHDLPPWETVCYHFSQWRDDSTWQQVKHELRVEIHVSVGKNPESSAAVLDSQLVKTNEPSSMRGRGYAAIQKVNGVKRHSLIDTLGPILAVQVLTADIQDRDGARIMPAQVRGKFPRLRKIWTDGGYAGALVAWVKDLCSWLLEIVKAQRYPQGFEVLPYRWIVGRTLRQV